jgi:hypothetical protein
MTAVRFSNDQSIELMMEDDAGFHDFTSGFDDAADCALGSDELPLTPCRVD